MDPYALDQLSAADAAVALRSYPRRFRAEVLPIAHDPEVEQRAWQIGPEGRSAAELVVATTNTLVLLGRALHDVVVQSDAALHPAVADPRQRTWEVPPGVTVEELLEQLGDACDALADAVERVHSPDWSRTASVVGDGRLSALDVVKQAVAAGIDNLRAVERTLRALRQR
ncbi:MAG: hypothetical protein MUF83_20645 [Acidimicrobiales bacterium]|nr:hypothetical protein [Acidimicrobiales bacterium]